MQKCFLYHGTHSFKQHCQHLMHEFRQTKNELFGWKEDRPVGRFILEDAFFSLLYSVWD